MVLHRSAAKPAATIAAARCHGATHDVFGRRLQDVAAGGRRGHGQSRSEALPAGEDEMTGHFGEERLARRHGLVQGLFDPPEVLTRIREGKQRRRTGHGRRYARNPTVPKAEWSSEEGCFTRSRHR